MDEVLQKRRDPERIYFDAVAEFGGADDPNIIWMKCKFCKKTKDVTYPVVDLSRDMNSFLEEHQSCLRKEISNRFRLPEEKNEWILDENRNPVMCSDTEVWAKWMENFANRNILQTWLPNGYRISTVFLGMDYSFGDHSGPILFETMVFHRDGEPGEDCACERSKTEAEAEQAHEEMMEKYRGKKDEQRDETER